MCTRYKLRTFYWKSSLDPSLEQFYLFSTTFGNLSLKNKKVWKKIYAPILGKVTEDNSDNYEPLCLTFALGTIVKELMEFKLIQN